MSIDGQHDHSTYLKATYTEAAEGNVMINVEDVTLKDVTVKAISLSVMVLETEMLFDGVRLKDALLSAAAVRTPFAY